MESNIAQPPMCEYPPEKPLDLKGNYRKAFADLHTRLYKLSKLVHVRLKALLEGDFETAKDGLAELSEAWFEYMMLNRDILSIVSVYGDGLRVCPLMQCFVEYQRMELICAFESLKTTEVTDVETDAGKALVNLTLGEVVSEIQKLPLEQMHHRDPTYVKVLALRSACFWCQTMPKETVADALPDYAVESSNGLLYPNFAYGILITCYLFKALMRIKIDTALHAKSQLRPCNGLATEEDEQRVKHWVVNVVVSKLGDDMLFECYSEAVEMHYALFGDEQWCAYKYPDRGNALGTILRSLRPVMAGAYFSEMQLTTSTLVGRLGETPLSRLFVLMIVGRYMTIFSNFRWFESIVIPNKYGDGLLDNGLKLVYAKHPLIVETMDRGFVVVRNKRPVINTTNSIFWTVATWFKLVHNGGGVLDDKIDLRSAIKSMFAEPPSQVENTNVFVDRI